MSSLFQAVCQLQSALESGRLYKSMDAGWEALPAYRPTTCSQLAMW